MAINQLNLPEWRLTPQVDWTPLNKIGDAVYQQREDAQLRDIVNGAMKPDGTLDYTAAGKGLIGAGKLDPGLKMLALGQQYESANEFSKGISGILGGGQSPSVAPTYATPTRIPQQPTPQGMMPATDLAPSRPKVGSSPSVMGDEEAIRTGLYDTSPQAPQAPQRFVQAPLAPPAPVPPQGVQAAPVPPMTGPRSALERSIPVLARGMMGPGVSEGQRAVGLEMLKAALQQSSPTNEQRNARDPAILDFEARKAAATRPTPQYQADVHQAEAIGKAYGDMSTATQKSGRDASKTMGTLNLMEKLTYDPNFYAGFGGETALMANRALASFGVKDVKAASSAEVFKALGNQTVLDATGGSLGNQISNSDRDFITSASPQLSTTPEGNRQLIGIRRQLAQRQIDVAKWARDYTARNGKLDAGWDDELARRVEANPLFPPMTPNAGPGAGAAPQQQAPPMVATKGDRDRLKPGTVYTAPDGSLRTKQ